eukprot:gb/GECG01003189.1/.p1 GENE.gb/GECG01003189.1/~~gb/GECG01003189.1/.p1  ORF type:complete len:164 (+),score=22.16 gb/GECG01003189.1/:1-492(+)
MSMADNGGRMTCVLVLIGGPPAAGKSTLLERIAAPEEGDSRKQVFKLDDEFDSLMTQRRLVEYSLEEVPATRFGEETRKLWHLAREELYHRVRDAVERILRGSETSSEVNMEEARGKTVTTIFVEDNFHLPSMRKPYFHLAAECTYEAPDAGGRELIATFVCG